MPKNYKEATYSPYYGYPIYYRIEYRSKKTVKDNNAITKFPVIILSHRLTATKIDYEHPPRTINNLQALLDDDTDTPLSERLPDKLMQNFFRSYLGLDKNPDAAEIQTARLTQPELTLGALLAAFDEELTSGIKPEREKSTIEDENRAIKRLLKNVGHAVLKDITPDHFENWTFTPPLSPHGKKACATILTKLIRELCSRKATDDSLLTHWEEYHPLDGVVQCNSPKRNIWAYIDSKTLTTGQSAAIISACCEELAAGKPTQGGLATLFQLTHSVPFETLCGLNCSDITPLSDYPGRFTVHLSKEYVLSGAKSQIKLFSAAYKDRHLPLSQFLSRYYTAYYERYYNGKSHGAPKGSQNASMPLFSYGSDMRRLNAKQLAQKCDEWLQDKFTLSPVFSGTKRKDKTRRQSMLRATAQQNLIKHGYDDNECRYHLGMAPNTTASIHYADYRSPVEINKLAAAQDHWLNPLMPDIAFADMHSDCVQSEGCLCKKWTPQRPSSRLAVETEIELSKIMMNGSSPDNTLTLALACPSGMYATIEYVK